MNAREPTSQPVINCPIGLFSEQEAAMVRLTQAINHTRTAAEKAPSAMLLMQVAEVLLACQTCDEQSLDCRLCREFSTLRLKTASIIVQASRLPAHDRCVR